MPVMRLPDGCDEARRRVDERRRLCWVCRTDATRMTAMVRRRVTADAGAMTQQTWSSRRLALVSIAGSWGFYLAFIAIRLKVIAYPREMLLLERHCLSASVGALLTWLLYLMLSRLEHLPVALRILAAITLAVPAAALLTLVNYDLLYVLAPQRLWPLQVRRSVTLRGMSARTFLERYFVFTGWATLYTSISSAVESQDALRRAAASEAATRVAQLQALRYQLNPHFLFNALNTVSALVLRGDAQGAEQTIQALSAFLRSSLENEAMLDTSLEAELELQRLYLEIEQVRFGERLHVHVVVPGSLRPALLPPLLLQPLVENVVRHAVARTSAPVTMTITAFADVGRLHLLVEDDGPGGGSQTGSSIGLRNVAARLALRFGTAARCIQGLRPGGGFRVELVLPLRLPVEDA